MSDVCFVEVKELPDGYSRLDLFERKYFRLQKHGVKNCLVAEAKKHSEKCLFYKKRIYGETLWWNNHLSFVPLAVICEIFHKNPDEVKKMIEGFGERCIAKNVSKKTFVKSKTLARMTYEEALKFAKKR